MADTDQENRYPTDFDVPPLSWVHEEGRKLYDLLFKYPQPIQLLLLNNIPEKKIPPFENFIRLQELFGPEVYVLEPGFLVPVTGDGDPIPYEMGDMLAALQTEHSGLVLQEGGELHCDPDTSLDAILKELITPKKPLFSTNQARVYVLKPSGREAFPEGTGSWWGDNDDLGLEYATTALVFGPSGYPKKLDHVIFPAAKPSALSEAATLVHSPIVYLKGEMGILYRVEEGSKGLAIREVPYPGGADDIPQAIAGLHNRGSRNYTPLGGPWEVNAETLPEFFDKRACFIFVFSHPDKDGYTPEQVEQLIEGAPFASVGGAKVTSFSGFRSLSLYTTDYNHFDR